MISGQELQQFNLLCKLCDEWIHTPARKKWWWGRSRIGVAVEIHKRLAFQFLYEYQQFIKEPVYDVLNDEWKAKLETVNQTMLRFRQEVVYKKDEE